MRVETTKAFRVRREAPFVVNTQRNRAPGLALCAGSDQIVDHGLVAALPGHTER